MAQGDLRYWSGYGWIRVVCADDDRRLLCSVRMRTLVGRWVWGLHRSRRGVGGRVMRGEMRWLRLRGVLVLRWKMEGGCGNVAVQGSLDEPEGDCTMLEDASVAHDWTSRGDISVHYERKLVRSTYATARRATF